MITVPVVITRVMRGSGPGDQSATELMRYLSARDAQDLNNTMYSAEMTGRALVINDKTIYLDPVSESMDLPFGSVNAALAAGWPIDLDALAQGAP